MLAPGGRLVLTVRPYRSHGQLVDLPGDVTGLAVSTGLALVERRVALLCGLRDGQFVPRASFFQINHQRRTFERMLLIAHEDVLVFARQQPEVARP